jgi:hypothetical protein
MGSVNSHALLFQYALIFLSPFFQRLRRVADDDVLHVVSCLGRVIGMLL